jgi:uncharacterized ion transporter superfamily protein YfcC
MDAILVIILIVLFVWTVISHMMLSGEINRIEKKYDHSIRNLWSQMDEIKDTLNCECSRKGNN